MNKKVIIGIVVIVLVTFGIISAVAIKSLNKNVVVEEMPTPTIVLPTVSESIKVDLTAKNDNKTISLKINGIPADIETI